MYFYLAGLLTPVAWTLVYLFYVSTKWASRDTYNLFKRRKSGLNTHVLLFGLIRYWLERWADTFVDEIGGRHRVS